MNTVGGRRRSTRKHDKHGNKVTLGLVYANWCGHCQALKPEWKSMKAQIAKNPKLRNQCKIIEYESDSPIPDNIKNIVQGYPTIFSIDHHGKMKKYEGGRSSADLLNYIEKQIGGSAESNNEEQDQQKQEEHEQEQEPLAMAGGKKHNKSNKRKTAKHRKSKKSHFFSFW